MINAVGPHCIELGIKISDIPKFIHSFQNTPIPFSDNGLLKNCPC